MNGNLKSFSPPLSFFEKTKIYARLMRLDRPIGIYLCLCPALWSLSLTSLPSPRLIALFILGAILTRGAGCTINDLIDREVDKKVSRTQNRPLAAGLLSPLFAIVFLGLQLLGALCLLLTFNKLTILLGGIIVIPIGLYPFFKRFTYWPQLFLGIIFNWGALMAGTALHNSLSLPVLVLYVACIFWTLGYDTLYAFQDYEDDKKIGIKSLALKVGYEKGKIFIGICYVLFFGGLLGSAFLTQNVFLGLSLIPLALSVFWHLRLLSLKSASDCGKFFIFQGKLGFLIWASLLVSNFVSLGL